MTLLEIEKPKSIVSLSKLLFLCQNESKRKTTHENYLRLQVQFHANESYFRNNGFTFGLVLKERHKELGNDLLSTTNGNKDSVPKERCLLVVRILTDSSRDLVQSFKSFFSD